ncbi:MAG TPA: SGNH/GDSL hydrolase family protein [Streptosporangiaceae bacterium]|nr:SGNH/GDSL hydrolase family protein [Streptosporangiaceae bacterium]
MRRLVPCASALAALIWALACLSGCASPGESKANADAPAAGTGRGAARGGAGGGGDGGGDTAARAPAPVVMILGDSYTAGLPDVTPEETFAADAARRLKWQLIIAGHYGSGFVTPGRSRQTFAQLFSEQLAWRPAPDMVVVSGGHNDWPHSYDKVTTAARQLLTAIKRRWPDSRLVLMGPLWGSDPPPKGLQVRDALQDVAAELRMPFIDPLAEQWITGDIRSGIGNAPAYIRGDGTHPNAAGNRYFADRFIADLRKLELTRPRLGS